MWFKKIFKPKDPDSNSSEGVVSGKELKEVLGHVVSPKVAGLGLRWNGGQRWVGESNGRARMVLYYQLLKGARGTFAWGFCFDFIPVISAGRLTYHRTEKEVILHLFEWPKEYSDSFLKGGDFSKGLHLTGVGKPLKNPLLHCSKGIRKKFLS